jgi:hypothetical protein
MASIPCSPRHERAVLVAPILVVACASNGCAVVSIVGSTVRVAGKVVEKSVDLVVPGSTPGAK